MKRTFAAATSSLDNIYSIADAAYFSSSTPASSRQYAIKEGKYGGCKKHICRFSYVGKASKCCFAKVIKTAGSGKPYPDVR